MGDSLYLFCQKNGRLELLEQWDSETNFPITPDLVTYGSTKKVWWKCDKGHRWQATVNGRTSGATGCPYCSGRIACSGENDLLSNYPQLAEEWHPTKNMPLTPDMVLPGSEKKVWWLCKKGHEWQAKIRSRVNGCGCPVCANRTVVQGVNDLSMRYPAIAQDWHPTKNGLLTPCDVVFGTKRKVWWRCKRGHEWRASVQSRTLSGTGCPVCTGRVVLPGENDMATLFADIAREWHPTWNGSLLPSEVAYSSKRRVWWRCPLGHDYMAEVGMRTIRKSGCPYCAGKKVLEGFNDLATTQPEVAAQWHPALNGAFTPQMVTAGSHKKVWWECAKGHVWKAAVYSRAGTQRRGCPVCAGVISGKRKLRYEKGLAELKEVVGV